MRVRRGDGLADPVGGLLPGLPQLRELLVDLLRALQGDPGSERRARLRDLCLPLSLAGQD
jgi:hypothetical protein